MHLQMETSSPRNKFPHASILVPEGIILLDPKRRRTDEESIGGDSGVIDIHGNQTLNDVGAGHQPY